MTYAWRKSIKEFRGCWPLPPPPPPSTSRRSPHRLPPPSVGGNAHQDSSRPNNTLNNSSSSARRRITATTVMRAVATVAEAVVAPPTPLPPRVRGPASSTLGLTLFKCAWVLRGGQRPAASPTSIGYAGQGPSLRPHHRSGRPTLHRLHPCPSIMVSSRLQCLRLRRHGPHGWAHEINNHWPTPSTP
jgi:hypothetical protein